MILPARQPIVDLPAQHVAQVVIVHERQDKTKVPGQFGPVVAFLPSTGHGVIKRSTTLMRLREDELARLDGKAPDLFAMPTYWCPRADGRVGIWPVPDQDYDAEAMGRNGKPIGTGRRAPVAVAPVEAMLASYARAEEETAAKIQQAQNPQRVERFTAAAGDDV